MFENKLIESKQLFENKEIMFDPDSSPETWEHFQKIYADNKFINDNYNFSKLSFYQLCYKLKLKSQFQNNKRLNYVNKPIEESSYNRLFILEKGIETKTENGVDYNEAAYRLGGDCDFNFNEDKFNIFSNIIDNDQDATDNEQKNASQQLERCRDMHHSLLNFSLMEAIGGMQLFKGIGYDRFDTFISALDQYFKGTSDAVLKYARRCNRKALIDFLGGFKDIYQYCETFNLIDDEKLVNKIKDQGNLSITNVEDLVRYMNLAEEYWEYRKEKFDKIYNSFQK